MDSNDPFSIPVSAGTQSSASNTTEEQVEQEQAKYTQAKTRRVNSHTYDNWANTALKFLLALFIACLISIWFNFMRDIVIDYVGHLHSKGKEVPKEVVIAVITMGTVITGLMAHILKGLFSKASDNVKESKVTIDNGS